MLTIRNDSLNGQSITFHVNKPIQYKYIRTVNYLINDTLFPKNKLIYADCVNLAKQFTASFGLIYSNYYQLIDSITFDINHGKIEDTLFILSPLNMVQYRNNSNCDQEFITDNLLIIKCKISFSIFDNVIYNIYQAGIEHFERTDNKNVIYLRKNFGEGCTFRSYMYLGFYNNHFNIDSFYVRRACQGKVQETTIAYPKDSFNLEKYDRIYLDTLMARY